MIRDIFSEKLGNMVEKVGNRVYYEPRGRDSRPKEVNMDNKGTHSTIKEWRKEAHMTLHDMADALGMPFGTFKYEYYKGDDDDISFEFITACCDLFGKSADELRKTSNDN